MHAWYIIAMFVDGHICNISETHTLCVCKISQSILQRWHCCLFEIYLLETC